MQDKRFGTVGRELLEAKYRELYWQVLMGHAAEYSQRQMDKIVETLGYVPAA